MYTIHCNSPCAMRLHCRFRFEHSASSSMNKASRFFIHSIVTSSLSSSIEPTHAGKYFAFAPWEKSFYGIFAISSLAFLSSQNHTKHSKSDFPDEAANSCCLQHSRLLWFYWGALMGYSHHNLFVLRCQDFAASRTLHLCSSSPHASTRLSIWSCVYTRRLKFPSSNHSQTVLLCVIASAAFRIESFCGKVEVELNRFFCIVNI